MYLLYFRGTGSLTCQRRTARTQSKCWRIFSGREAGLLVRSSEELDVDPDSRESSSNICIFFINCNCIFPIREAVKKVLLVSLVVIGTSFL